jgi:hypothetical protein
MSAAMVLLAPGRFSTTTGLLERRRQLVRQQPGQDVGATAGEAPTMMRNDFSGQVWAAGGRGSAIASGASASSDASRRRRGRGRVIGCLLVGMCASGSEAAGVVRAA